MSQSTKSKSSTKGTKVVEKKEEQKVQEVAPVTPVEQVVEKKSTKKSSSKTQEKQTQESAVEVKQDTKTVKSAGSKKSGGSKKSAKKGKKVAKPKVVAKQENEGEDGEQEKGKRYFHCVYKSNDGSVVRAGRYCGKKPKQAARKALSRVVEKNEVENGKNLVFLIKECTRGSKKKMYAYSGSRVLLETPVTVPLKKLNKDGKPVVLTYKHANNVKKVALAECGDLVNVNFDDEENVATPVVAVQEAAPVVKVTKKSSKKTEEKVAPVETKAVVEEQPKKKTSKKEEPVKEAAKETTKEEVKVEKTKTKSKSK